MKILPINTIEAKKWSGGSTREYFRDQADFSLRISSATIDPGESAFSDFSGYHRFLFILKNEVTLNKETQPAFILKEGQSWQFLGSDKVFAKNTVEVIDFNVIWKPNFYNVIFHKISGSSIQTKGCLFILSLKDNTKLQYNNQSIKMECFMGLLDNSSQTKHLVVDENFIVIEFQKL